MMSTKLNLPEYQSVTAALRRADSDLSAAECHGLIAAMLLSGDEVSIADVFSREAAAAVDDEEFAALFRQLVQVTSEGYISEDFNFQLLLPDDDEPLAARVIALAEWCGGYVMGMLEAGINNFDDLPEDAAEVARDLVEISQLDDSAGDNGSDSDLMELEEYVRVGVQIIYSVLVQTGAEQSGVQDEDVTLQ